MTIKKIVVFGATGVQGSAVVHGLLHPEFESKFRVFGLTRNPHGEKSAHLAREYANKGKNFAGFVNGDMDKPETLTDALKDAWGVFICTNWWEHFDYKREIEQGKHAIDAARGAGAQYVVFSGLSSAKDFDPSATLFVDHLDGKREIEKYLLDDPVNSSIPHRAVVRMGCYMSNFTTFFVPRSYDGGKTYGFAACMGDKPWPMGDTDDMSPVLAQMFSHPEKYSGKIVSVVSDAISGAEIAKAFSDELGVPVVYNDMPVDAFRKLPFPHADELGRMFQLFADYWAPTLPSDVKQLREIVPNANTMSRFIHHHKDHIRQAMGLSHH